MKRVQKCLYLLGAILCFCGITTASGAPNSSVTQKKPNIIFILVDDMGYSDLGCYGGEIDTPNIDSLAEQGIRFTQFYNTAKCHSSRATLLTGLYAQQTGNRMKHEPIANAVTLGHVLKTAGYRTLASGKHHGTTNLYDLGFDHYYGLRDGASNHWNPGVKRDGEPEPGHKNTKRYWCDDEKTYHPFTPEDKDFYTTDAFTKKALEWLDEKELDEQPFFLYLAYNAPHYPLHAWPKDIEKYEGKYDLGYEEIREARYKRMVEMGLIDPEKSPLPEWDRRKWETLKGVELAKEKKRMEIYAAMLDCVDQNLGKIFAKLKQQGMYENTIIMFASDNGATAEKNPLTEIRSSKLEDLGTIASYETVGPEWATVQNTPLRKWKTYTQEGGIRTPFILSWPARIKNPGTFHGGVAHFIDIMPTYVELTGATYPESHDGKEVYPMEGISILPAIDNEALVRPKPIYWQFGKGGGLREGDMKAVFYRSKWELFDMSSDGNESNDLSKEMPELLKSMKREWSEMDQSPKFNRKVKNK